MTGLIERDLPVGVKAGSMTGKRPVRPGARRERAILVLSRQAGKARVVDQAESR